MIVFLRTLRLFVRRRLWDDLTSTFNDQRFLSIHPMDEKSAMLKKDGQDFRKVSCNCWHAPERIQDCMKMGVDIQVLSTIPALFSYWAKDNEGLQLSQFFCCIL